MNQRVVIDREQVGHGFRCYIGSAGPVNIGRFKPAFFEVDAELHAVNNSDSASQFTYVGQAGLGLTLKISAMSQDRSADLGIDPLPLSRYAGANGDTSSTRLKLATIAIAGDNAGSAVSLASRLSLPALAWTGGSYEASGAYIFDRLASGPDGPFDSFALKLSISGADGVTIASVNDDLYTDARNTATQAWTISQVPDTLLTYPTTRLRYGRLRLLNSYGSELLPARVEARAEYWGGNRWVRNTDDTSTGAVLSIGNFALGNRNPAGLGSSASAIETRGNGGWDIVLARPAGTPPGTGSLDLVLDLGNGTAAGDACLGAAWTNGPTGHTGSASLSHLLGQWCGSNYDKNPAARIKFGSPKAPYIYLREQY